MNFTEKIKCLMIETNYETVVYIFTRFISELSGDMVIEQIFTILKVIDKTIFTSAAD